MVKIGSQCEEKMDSRIRGNDRGKIVSRDAPSNLKHHVEGSQ